MGEWPFRRCTSVELYNATQEQEEKEIVSQIAVQPLISRVDEGTSQFTAAPLAFAHALEQKLCRTPEAGSSHLGCRWQFCERRVRNEIWKH